LTAMTSALSANWTSSVSEPARIFLHDPGSFGDVDAFKERFAEVAVGQFGSGWAWLIAEGGKLKVIATPRRRGRCVMSLPALHGQVVHAANRLRRWSALM